MSDILDRMGKLTFADRVSAGERITVAEVRDHLAKVEGKLDFFMKIFNAFSFLGGENLFWRTDNEFAPIRIYVTCNSLFYWGSADSEEITPENVDMLLQTREELKSYAEELDDGYLDFSYLAPLFCARSRGMRPQGIFYAKYLILKSGGYSILLGQRGK